MECFLGFTSTLLLVYYPKRLQEKKYNQEKLSVLNLPQQGKTPF